MDQNKLLSEKLKQQLEQLVPDSSLPEDIKDMVLAFVDLQTHHMAGEEE